MDIPADIKKLIHQSQNWGHGPNAIKTTKGTRRLSHVFWSFKEIEASFSKLNDWSVSANYVPFYGDWHTLFCVDLDTMPHKVVELDDERNIVNIWESMECFQNALTNLKDEVSDAKEVIESESWLDF